MVNLLADSDFKRRDANGDGFLNQDEMPASLRSNLAKWDRNGDGLIDIQEYRAYYGARLAGDQEANMTPKGVTSIIIDEDELDRKPVVLRAGKLPANMPAWFKQLDTDGDGQVALYEWRAGGKSLDEFKTWDMNDDGFITPEEALKGLEVHAKDNPKGNPASSGADGFPRRRSRRLGKDAFLGRRQRSRRHRRRQPKRRRQKEGRLRQKGARTKRRNRDQLRSNQAHGQHAVGFFISLPEMPSGSSPTSPPPSTHGLAAKGECHQPSRPAWSARR